MKKYPLLHSPNSPPSLFVLSEFVYPENHESFIATRLNYNATPLQVKEDVKGTVVERAFCAPVIASEPKLPLQKIKAVRWMEGDPNGRVQCKQVDVYYLNMLHLPEVLGMALFWTRVDDVVDTYPQPTVRNPLPILTAHRKGRTELFNVTWMTQSYADKRTLQYIDESHKIVNEQLGMYTPLQEEQRQIGDCGVIALSHLPECIRLSDITGILGIIDDVRRVCDALDSLC